VLTCCNMSRRHLTLATQPLHLTPPHHLTLLDLLGKSAQPTPTWEPGWGDLSRLANLATRTCARCGLVGGRLQTMAPVWWQVWSSLEQSTWQTGRNCLDLSRHPSRHPSRLGVWEAVWSSSWEAAPDTLPRHPSGTRPGGVLERLPRNLLQTRSRARIS
jgi:hypothetical protein